MKQLMILALAAGLCTGAHATDGFWKQLTDEEREAAGVGELTPEQQAALDRAVARFATEGARKARDEARAEAKAEAKAMVGLEPERDEIEPVHARIQGKFEGWRKGMMFELDNGQAWQVVGSDTRSFRPMMNPEVEIRPAGFGSWKLYLVTEKLWVRVRRVR